MRKVIFLDIDGVLQPFDSEERKKNDLDKLQKELAEKYNDQNYFDDFTYNLGAIYYDWKKESVELLRRLIKETNSEVVLSSTWGKGKTMQQINRIFKIHNLEKYITDVTPNGLTRATEIKMYLDEHKDIEEYVILDDLPDKDLFQIGINFIHIKYDYFRKREFKKAKSILNIEDDKSLVYRDFFANLVLDFARDGVKYFIRGLFELNCKDMNEALYWIFYKTFFLYEDVCKNNSITTDKENLYYLIEGLFNCLETDWELVESLGKYKIISDYEKECIILEPRDISKTAFIIELKIAEEEDTLETAVNDALTQIEYKKYDTKLIDKGIKEIEKLGMAFIGRKALVSNKIIEIVGATPCGCLKKGE